MLWIKNTKKVIKKFIEKGNIQRSCWLLPFENQWYHIMVLSPRVGTLLEGRYMGTICVLNSINTLTEHTHLSTTNSSNLCSNIKVKKEWRKFKNMSSTTVAQVIRCKGTTFSFFWHSLLLFLLFPSFSHAIVQWVSFHFFVLSYAI